jgi:1,2-diacylglycerol 3-alpha-glucosyltransferase
MLRIAIFSEVYHPMRNGVVVSIDSFARILIARGHEVTIFTAQQTGSEEETGVFRFPSLMVPNPGNYPLAIPLAEENARLMLREHPFDLIHSNSPMVLGHVASHYAWRRRIPLVFTYHTLLEEYAHYWSPLPETWVRHQAATLSRRYSNAADHIITPTQHVATRLRRYGVQKPISVIPTGIDVDLIDLVPDDALRARFGIPDEAPLLVYVGRLAKEKNIGRLLGAFAELRRYLPEAHLLLVGGGPEAEAIRERIDALGLNARAHLSGYVGREQVVQAMRAADLFVFASRTETQGLVIGEAMACRLPIVAVEAEATRELVEHGVQGLIAPDADGPFAEAMLTLLSDPARRAIMAAAARTRAELLSAPRCAEKLEAVYHLVLAGR